MSRRIKLSNLATLQFGFYAKPIDSGSIGYILARHFDGDSFLLSGTDTFLNAAEVSESHLLQLGDVLFVGKGNRNFAWAYTEELGLAVASSIFFVIRVNTTLVNPEYLAILLNSRNYQSIFQQMGAGSKIPSIRKSELESLEIKLPSLEQQMKIVEFNALHIAEETLRRRIIDEKSNLHNAILNKLLNQ